MFINTAVRQRQMYFVPVYLGCNRINDKLWLMLPEGMVEIVDDDQSKIMPPHIWGRFHVSNLYS